MRYLILFFMLVVQSCAVGQFAKGVASDTKKRFFESKEFMYRISFSGTVVEKKFCKKCELNRYQLKLKVQDLSEKPGLTLSDFSPYYSFEGDTVLYISVLEKLYAVVKENAATLKSKDQYTLKIDGTSVPYLNTQENKWFAE